MKYQSLVLTLGLTVLPLLSCGPRASLSDSQTQGHYESSSFARFQEKADRQRVPPEWAPSRGVIISQLLVTKHSQNELVKKIIDSGVDKVWIIAPKSSKETISSTIYRDLRKTLGKAIDKIEIVSQQRSGEFTVWARDWAPLGALTDKGEMRLLDFNYFPEREADDFTAQSMERLLKFDRMSVPVYNEGGNFMINGRGVCFMTTRVIEANSDEEKDRPDDIVLDGPEIQDYYKKAAGCRDVRILPRMPYEGTGHIDMWAKFVSDDTILISELRQEVVDSYTAEKNQKKALKVKAFLDERAAQLEDMGYHVERLPMPGPIFDGKEIFRSYTNSLIVNQLALVPRYAKPKEDDIANFKGQYFDQKFLAGYETEVRKTYDKYSDSFSWITVDDLIYIGGAIHCATMQIPR